MFGGDDGIEKNKGAKWRHKIGHQRTEAEKEELSNRNLRGRGVHRGKAPALLGPLNCGGE